jgi:hypothetical protein
MSNEYSYPGPSPQWQPPPPPPKKHTGRNIALISVGVVVLLMFLGFCAAVVSSVDGTPADPETIPVPQETTAQSSPPSKAPAPPRAQTQDGTWLVPAEMKPGTYRSGDGSFCYWARLKGTSGSFDDIIINGNGPNQTVTIKATDKAFEHHGCEGWKKIS